MTSQMRSVLEKLNFWNNLGQKLKILEFATCGRSSYLFRIFHTSRVKWDHPRLNPTFTLAVKSVFRIILGKKFQILELFIIRRSSYFFRIFPIWWVKWNQPQFTPTLPLVVNLRVWNNFGQNIEILELNIIGPLSYLFFLWQTKWDHPSQSDLYFSCKFSFWNSFGKKSKFWSLL